MMLSRLITIALAVEVLLVCIEGTVPSSVGYLPLGGSHLGQLGFVLGLAVAVTNLSDALQKC